jgi:hypothetical protein
MENEEDRPFSFALLVEVSSAKNGFANYLGLSHEIEQMLTAKGKEIERKTEEAYRHSPEHQHEDIAEDHAWEIRPYTSLFPYVHRESMFITLYSHFEGLLNRLCARIAEEVKSRVQLKHVRGAGVERAILFLKLVPEFRFDGIPAVMEQLSGAGWLRNRIAHAGSTLPEDGNDRLNKFVAKHPYLGGSSGEPVLLEREFVAAFADTLTQFLTHLEAEMQSYMDRTWRDALKTKESGTTEE